MTHDALTPADELFADATYRPRYEVVTLPVSGRRVRIRSLPELELEDYEAAPITGEGNRFNRSKLKNAARRLIVLCLVDAAGNRLCNDSHIERLAAWDAADVQFCYDRCARHCGINRRDIEDLKKNSDAAPAGDSPTE